jgi:hypothetical protein
MEGHASVVDEAEQCAAAEQCAHLRTYVSLVKDHIVLAQVGAQRLHVMGRLRLSN